MPMLLVGSGELENAAVHKTYWRVFRCDAYHYIFSDLDKFFLICIQYNPITRIMPDVKLLYKSMRILAMPHPRP